MMTSISNKFLQRLGASSSSADVNFLTLAFDSVQDIAHFVHSGVQLNERQCQDLYSKLFKTMENIQILVPHSRASTVPFQPALKNLYRVTEKAKLLVGQCCSTDLCKAAVFQIRNEESFREILLEVGLCFNVIYELAEHIIQDLKRTPSQAKDLRKSSLFLFASESEVLQDQQALKDSLEHLARTSNDLNQCLARYLLGKLQCLYKEHNNEDLSILDGLLWRSETEPKETWKLLYFLGKGSGAVAVCCCTWFDIPCARKQFDGQVQDEIFQSEATILARLNHPNIVKFFCCKNGLEKGQCFIAMELMEMSLNDLIENRGKEGQLFPISVVLDIISQIARGMYYLHGQNIAHRDLKPLNVVVTKLSTAHLQDNFCVKLVDFGMSKIKLRFSKSNSISKPGVCTTIYRAPEVFPQEQVAAGGKKKVNWFRADVYSFAITCAELLSLKEPFKDVLRSELYAQLQNGRRPKLPQGCLKDLVVLLKECWTTNPEGRPNFENICSRIEKCKFQDILKRSSTSMFEHLQQPFGYEYIERVLTKQPIVQSLCATIIPNDVDVTKKIGLWSRAKASFAQVMSENVMGAKSSRRKSNLQSKFQEIFKELGVNPTIFPYNELRNATQHFHDDMKLRKVCYYGSIYKGELQGKSVAVKRLYNDFQEDEFVQDLFSREVSCLSKLKHKNLVNLKGCCIDEGEMLLVYEYEDNFDVGQILFGSRKMVSWQVRLKIILGIARGLYYMHEHANPRFIHRDINRHNIVLDKHWEPMITGFGLALSFPNEECYIESDIHGGSVGYLAPECYTTMRVNDKVDVYSFGILCMEIISAQRFFGITRLEVIHDWAWCVHEEDRAMELVDSTLNLSDEEVRDVQRVMKMSVQCTQEDPELRPSMAQVMSMQGWL